MLTLFLILIGVFAGVLAGLLGIGGGLIFAPVLFYMFDARGIENPEVWAIGSSLLCTFATSSGASIKQRHMGTLSPSESFKVGMFGIAGTIIGKTIVVSEYFNSRVFLTIFLIILIYTGVQFIRKAFNKTAEPPAGEDRPVKWKEATSIGGGGGLVAALTGIGGGIVMVPIMNMIYNIRFQKAVSISVGAILIISLSGVIQLASSSPNGAGITPYTLGYVDIGSSLALSAGAIIGAFSGTWLQNRINLKLLNLLFAAIVLIAAARMLLDVVF